MITRVIAGALLLGSANLAQGADAIVDQVIVVGTAYDWSGVYIGATAGASFYDPHWTDRADDWFQGTRSFDSTSAAIGGYVGYNYDTGPLIVGVEGDFVGAFNSDEQGGPRYDERYENDLDWLASLRGRIGIPHGQFLFYATGGVAFAGVKNESSSDDYPDEDFEDTDSTLTGYTVGGGVEYAMSSNISVRLEGFYYDFGSETYKQESQPAEEMTIDNTAFVIRAGIGYKF
jgi:outer membrane immunogenic protein